MKVRTQKQAATNPRLRAAVENPLDCPENVSLCIQAARSGGIDLKTGTAELDGNVRGYIKERELRFAAESLKAFRNEGKEWTRLVLDRNVRLNQPDTVATADHAVLEQERALLFGNGRAERPPYKIEADEIELQDAPSSITAKGTTEKPARVFYNPGEGADAKTSGDEPTAEKSLESAEKPETILIQALLAVVDRDSDEVRLTGQAVVDRPGLGWRLEANSAVLKFNGQRGLESFRAEGGVQIFQPERLLKSDIAVSQNNNETILLIGNASIEQEGQFQLSSDRLEVYTDAQKGMVQGQDKQKPIKLAFDLSRDKKKPWRLDGERLQKLGGMGVPFATLGKLEALMGKSYPDQSKFETAVRGVLTNSEAASYLEAIVAHAN